MHREYLIYALLVLLPIVLFAWPRLKNRKSRPDTDTRRPPQNKFPTHEVKNDKLVIVDDICEVDLGKILQEVCNAYNKEAYKVLPRMIRLEDKKFAVTFPYDIQFDMYCVFINYVYYPIGFDRQFHTVGWATTKGTDTWITEKSANKNVMLFISDHDTECDNVFMTTANGIGYKMGFAIGHEKQLLDKPEKPYTKPPVAHSEIATKPYEDFR